MRIHHNLDLVPATERAITIGVFDGVHQGHRALLNQMLIEARRRNLTATVITFPNHPQSVLNPPAPPLLTTIDERIELLEELGIEETIVLTFTIELSQRSAERFCREILIDKLNCKLLVVGDDFALGHRREGNVERLKQLGKEMGFEVLKVSSVILAGIRISSSEIRQMLLKGEIEKASELLGKPYRLKGFVQKGTGRGHQLGFPTINLRVSQEKLLPLFGVYASRAHLKGTSWDAAVYIGQRPTFGETEISIEAHLLGFNGSVSQGTIATLELLAFIRPDRKFDSVDALIAQMNSDLCVVTERLKVLKKLDYR
ncbi:MAG: bifunctional riboflavin kinase/FAD synthetase [Armatimonadetes bacterium]|nr:bifunctional riboflavin kinase/FAD synthetase [Armatimonadota bacterium]